MAFRKKRWYDNLFFEFYLSIPLVTIETRLFKEAYDRLAYDICRVRIKVWRWKYEFQLYRRPSY